MSDDRDSAVLCLTFDNMGMARAVGAGEASRPDEDEPGLRVGYPRVLDLLDELGIKATFFIEAWNCLHHADRVQEIARRGHEIGMHGFVHEKFGALPKLRVEQVLYDSFAAFESLGVHPIGFRAPGGVRGPFAIEPLVELGIRFDSSLPDESGSVEQRAEMGGADTPPDRTPQPHALAPGLVTFPFEWRLVDAYLYRSDGGTRTPEDLVEDWSDELHACARSRNLMTVIFHPYVSGTRDDRYDGMRRFLELASNDPSVRISTMGEQAMAFRSAGSVS